MCEIQGRCVVYEREGSYSPEYFTVLWNFYRKTIRTRRLRFTEIINLQAIVNLPKGTEHFMSDLHGEYEAFLHILNNCSGVIREKVEMIFKNSLPKEDQDDFIDPYLLSERKVGCHDGSRPCE